MKKKTIFQCVILFFSILNIHVGMAGPEQVSMHIYGNVVDQGCDVATKSALQNIHIGDFNISDFQAANTVSTAADLNIDITGCAAGITGADVLFSGEADTLAPTLLKLTDTGGSGGMATGIAVQILDAQSQQEIPLNQVQPLTPLKAGDNTLKYQLRYKSTKAGATGGNATAVLYFDLVYHRLRAFRSCPFNERQSSARAGRSLRRRNGACCRAQRTRRSQ